MIDVALVEFDFARVSRFQEYSLAVGGRAALASYTIPFSMAE